MLFIFLSLGLFFILVDSFVAGASKTQEEFSQVFTTKIDFLGGKTRIKISNNKTRKIL